MEFSNLDILARIMSIWDKICYDKEKMMNNYGFMLSEVFGFFLPISVLLYVSLALQAQWLTYVPPGLTFKNFTLSEQNISIW
jgi:hypothetical protein